MPCCDLAPVIPFESVGAPVSSGPVFGDVNAPSPYPPSNTFRPHLALDITKDGLK